MNMQHYAEERKSAVILKLLPPMNQSVTKVSQTEGIGESTLYNWLNKARKQGIPVPGHQPVTAEDWNAEAKLAVVNAAATFNAIDLAEYCRSKGLYVEQVERWKQACLGGFADQKAKDKQTDQKLKIANRQILRLEKNLNRKDKALAEAAALLVLQKKLNTLWGDEDE